MTKKLKQPFCLLRIDDLTVVQIKKIIEAAYAQLKKGKLKKNPKAKGIPVGLIFAEPSTRTRVSFERAAKDLGFDTYLLESQSSSLSKGEDLADTIFNLQSLGVNHFVVRTSSTSELLSLRNQGVGVLNAGDGVGEHPSQALLDLLCLFAWQRGSWKALLTKKLLIVGNLSHSRVANSWQMLSRKLGLKLSFVSPKEWAPQDKKEWSADVSKALASADVVMALRVQKERLGGAGQVDLNDYVSRYQIRAQHLNGRPLMHPGPVNWGVELNEELRAYKNSLILDQVRCGYFLRATLLNELIATNPKRS